MKNMKSFIGLAALSVTFFANSFHAKADSTI